jgi:hypothetical protein
MWMGLTSKSVNLATLKTILFVQLIPWFVISFAAGVGTMLILVPALMGSGTGGSLFASMMWYPLIMAGVTMVLALIKNVGFVIYARRRLHAQFRGRAAQSFDRTPPALPPIVRQPESTAANF